MLPCTNINEPVRDDNRGKVLYDGARRTTIRIVKGNAATWVALEAFNDGREYELNTRHEVLRSIRSGRTACEYRRELSEPVAR